MRLGIFGGTFDPVHYGHLLLAECCREQRQLDQVWFLPAAVPPHKQDRQLTLGELRAEMLELAVGGNPAFAVCRHEIERGGVNFSVDTLAHFHREQPDGELFFLMGADSLRDLADWKNPAGLCALATPIVVGRSQAAAAEAEGELDFGRLVEILPPDRLEAIRSHRVNMPTVALSSSEIRQRVAAGQSVRYRTPRAVEKYIETHGLYLATG